MADEQARALSNVRCTATDGRLQNIYWRLDQLRSLHTTLVSHEASVLEAITNDSHNTLAEAKIELYLALAAVKQHFLSLHPDQELEREYRVAHGKDAADRRDPVGIVYIEPATTHTPFYSVVVPLAAAIAAGNCVVVQLSNTLQALPAVLRQTLTAALDPDVYAVVAARPDAAFLAAPNVLSLLQNGAGEGAPPSALVSRPAALSVAIVERSADLAAAAKALVTARFAFNGRSPYAPDVVLVNEFAKEAFLNAAVQESIRYMAEGNGVAANGKAGGKAGRGGGVVEELKGEAGVRVVTAGSNGAILEVEKRDSAALGRKISERGLVVHAITSIDDGIDLANRIAGSPLATYLFADPASCKYMSQFTPSHLSFTNHFPLDLLVGPTAPSTHPLDPSSRFPPALFTLPRPQYANPTPLAARLSAALREGGKADVLRALKDGAAAPLPPNRPYTKGVGFFEQGILLGLGMAGVPLLGGLGVLTWWASRSAWAYWRGWLAEEAAKYLFATVSVQLQKKSMERLIEFSMDKPLASHVNTLLFTGPSTLAELNFEDWKNGDVHLAGEPL
ncbi:putative aldehyde dehydrogenase protein [Neofusicoccum parvum UCRNP2]|uniref:Putative aldehyde dehydrogenase protein n=1 Tax=Botryosphaeria parva (strain UCR-NP2) TaxID=1287680 RepID=R1EI10_BOTPV|nr:putative aldehyde dehydrogenase protein [Neofusicoccum parvum UCRNP2]